MNTTVWLVYGTNKAVPPVWAIFHDKNEAETFFWSETLKNRALNLKIVEYDLDSENI